MDTNTMKETKTKLVEMAASLKLHPEEFPRGLQEIHNLTSALISDNTPGALENGDSEHIKTD